MISTLRGTVEHLGSGSAVVEVGGVGYLVHTTGRALQNLHHGSPAFFFTSMVVREDSMTLFGFERMDEREIFETLTSVSGVGPKIGLAVLNTLTADQVREAIAQSDDKAFSRVSGIGPKGARRIVLELAGKLIVAPAADSPETTGAVPGQVSAALTGLGWSEKDVSAALAVLTKTQPELMASGNTPAILKAALQHFNGGSETGLG